MRTEEGMSRTLTRDSATANTRRRQEQERISLRSGECYPGLKRDEIIEVAADDANAPAEIANATRSDDAVALSTPAYQKYFFYLQGPLVSPLVKFSEKKSIIGDDDDD